MAANNIFVFPGHKYLGPGNKLNVGSPVDTDDFIAEQHDIDYENACTVDDVYTADEKAIFAFLMDWLKKKNWHSAVGAMGLGMKHLAEVICGKIFYPKLPKLQN